MLSFAMLLEQMAQSAPLPLDPKVVNIVQTGLNLRESFWDDFSQICTDSAGLAELLGVKPEQVTSWRSRIQEALQQVEQQTEMPSPRQEMLPTGLD